MVSTSEVIGLIRKLGGGGSSGTTDYDDLTNKPQINGVTLNGDNSGDDLGLLDAPSTAGTSGQVLTSDGQGGQSWQDAPSGAAFVETVSGSTPSITGDPNVRYICGEVTSISITPPSAGTIVVRFTSGATPATLTLPQTVVFPSGINLSTLSASTVYEIMITDGVYGGVMKWAA